MCKDNKALAVTFGLTWQIFYTESQQKISNASSECPWRAPPVTSFQTTESCNYSDAYTKARSLPPNDDTKINDENVESVSQENAFAEGVIMEKEFVPKHPPRAHLNIHMPKELTPKLRGIIEENFENDAVLYYYIDFSTGLQIKDKQMKEFTFKEKGGDGDERKLSIVNYDLHSKESNNEDLYGIIVPNDDTDKIKQNKWLWKLHDFLTADVIEQRYKIPRNKLPQSSRQMASFQNQLQFQQNLVIKESLIDDTDWFHVQQINSKKPNVKVTITLTKEMWIQACKKSLQNRDLPLIPVVVNKLNNNHWIEWIKIIYIESQNIYAGISLKYEDTENGKWSVQSICLDRGDIYRKYRLSGKK